MRLDLQSLMVAAVLATCLCAGAFFVIWSKRRRETALLWMVAATVLGCLAALLRETLPATLAIYAANVVLFFSLSSIGTACRALGGRPFQAWRFLAPAGAWIVACTIPDVLQNLDMRIVLASGLVVILMIDAITELWVDGDEHLSFRRWLMVPLALNGLGASGRMLVIYLTSGAPRSGLASGPDMAAVTLWSLAFLQLTGFGVVAVVLQRSERQLQEAASRDGLTGLANRKQFDTGLLAAFQHALSTQTPIALLMIDVDDFKAYNDRHGHVAGDECLQAIAAVLTTTFQGRSAIIARYGGEEFAVVLPNMDARGALRCGDAVRENIRDLAITHAAGERDCVTVSVGIASSVPAAGSTVKQLLSAADRNLYAAKRGGRDQVVSGHASPPMVVDLA